MRLIKLFGALTLLVSMGLQASDKINEVLDVPNTGQVNIQSMRGTVKVIGWDKAQVSVTGELDEKATGYTFQSDNGFTVFKVKMPNQKRINGWNDSDGSDLIIYVPFDSDLTFESVSGDVSVKEVSGGTSVHTVNGSIDAQDLSRRIRLETVNGDIKASLLYGKVHLATVNGQISDKSSKGKIHYETVNGNIDSQTDASKVYVQNVNGEIELALKAIEDLEVSTVNGDIDASLSLADDGSVNVTTVSGSARLRFASTVGGKFRLSSHAGGRIKNRLTDDKVVKQKYGPASSLKFTKGGGNAKVQMTTVSGNLTIEQQ